MPLACSAAFGGPGFGPAIRAEKSRITAKSGRPSRRHSLAFSFWLAAVAWSWLGAISVAGLDGDPLNRQAATEALVRGDQFSSERQFDRAITEYTRAIILNPDFAEAFNNRGYARHCKREGSDAVSDLTKAIALREKFPHAYNTRGCAYLVQGRVAEAIADFDRAILLQPDYLRAYRNRGHAHLLQGSFRLAMTDLERAGSRPTRALLLLSIALVLVLGAIGATFYSLIRAQKKPQVSPSRGPSDR